MHLWSNVKSDIDYFNFNFSNPRNSACFLTNLFFANVHFIPLLGYTLFELLYSQSIYKRVFYLINIIWFNQITIGSEGFIYEMEEKRSDCSFNISDSDIVAAVFTGKPLHSTLSSVHSKSIAEVLAWAAQCIISRLGCTFYFIRKPYCFVQRKKLNITLEWGLLRINQGGISGLLDFRSMEVPRSTEARLPHSISIELPFLDNRNWKSQVGSFRNGSANP